MPIDLALMVNHLPPQAYSKETLIQAYNWLRHQPPQVQELAKTPDVLVSLFSKAQMHGDAYMNRAHMQNFKSELKSLANLMGDFDPDEVTEQGQSQQMNTQLLSSPGAISQSASLSSQSVTMGSQSTTVANNMGTQGSVTQSSPQVTQQLLVQQQNQLIQAQQQLAQLQQSQVQQSHVQQSQVPSIADIRSLMDARSISMIQEVKNQFNLSSEAEALRLLIAIGYQKIRSDL